MPKGIYNRATSQRRRPLSDETKKKIGLANSISLKGRSLSSEHRKNISTAKDGEKNPAWRGDNVGYRAIHKWVQRKLGKPNECVSCGKIATGHQMHWANISDEYKRDVTDWLRMCTTCHFALDAVKRFVHNATA